MKPAKIINGINTAISIISKIPFLLTAVTAMVAFIGKISSKTEDDNTKGQQEF